MHLVRNLALTLYLLDISHALEANAPNRAIGFFPQNKKAALKRLFANYATLSQFEKEEDDVDNSYWVDEVEDDAPNNNSDLFDDGNNDKDAHAHVEDDLSYEIDNNSANGPLPKKEFRWWNSNKDVSKSYDSDTSLNDNHVCEEHPMRTDEWLIQVRLSPFLILPGTRRREASLFPESFIRRKTHRKQNLRERQQLMKFGRDGYVLLLEEKDEMDDAIDGKQKGSIAVINMGRWEMSANGISWTLPASLSLQQNKRHDADNIEESKTRLHFHADLHLSKFQNKPRMFKGTITRDRLPAHSDTSDDDDSNIFYKKLLRPVIASFTAVGIGEDTLMLQYKERGFGLSGGNG